MPEPTTPSATVNIIALVWLNTEPPVPCPDVLTAEQAVVYLCLRKPRQTMKQALISLAYYRSQGKLRAARSGSCFVYRRVDLEEFIESQTTRGQNERTTP